MLIIFLPAFDLFDLRTDFPNASDLFTLANIVSEKSLFFLILLASDILGRSAFADSARA